MTTGRSHGRHGVATPVIFALLTLGVVPAPAQQLTKGSADTSGSACRPVSEKQNEIGCYILTHQSLGRLPQGPLFWHLDTYSARASAEATKGPRSAVVEAFGKFWLLTIAERGWRPSSGTRVAEIGPLPLPPAADFSAMYMEATFVPGGSVAPHRHAGPEAWYTLSGEQCLETPNGRVVARAGESTIIPFGSPMALLAIGKETRRSLVLILHDSSQPASTFIQDWTPKGLCAR
jgi:quercetin dioxygenase-like cupin family protein